MLADAHPSTEIPRISSLRNEHLSGSQLQSAFRRRQHSARSVAGAGMASSAVPPLVSVRWLREHLEDPDVRVLDASWHMPNARGSCTLLFPIGCRCALPLMRLDA